MNDMNMERVSHMSHVDTHAPMAARRGRASPSLALRILTLALVTAAIACADDPDASLLVFAAASLKEPMTHLADLHEARSGVSVNVSFGGSLALARQIEAGAPADLFVSAGSPPMRMLVSEGLVAPDSAAILFGNQLVIVTPPGAAPVTSLHSLTESEVETVAIVNPGLGPAGWYAENALRSAGLWDALLPKTIQTPDVRAALAVVSAGNADAAFVYRTDAMTAPELGVAFAVPPDLHPPIEYVAAPIRASDNPESASLMEFLSSDEALAVFARFGFLMGDE